MTLSRVRIASFVAVVVLLGAGSTALAQSTYYPPPGDWERRTPAEVGMDSARLTDAIAYAESRETSKPMDFSDQETLFGQRLGPIPDRRAHTNGLVVRHGYIVAEFGDTTKVDPTYSAAKSYLSTLVGVAVDQGLIHDVHDPVRDYVDDGGYASPQNAPVTWHHHLQQTTEWEGELWDRTHDFVGAKAFGNGEREPRALQAPGTYYEYNDVRINRLALSLMRVFGRPLPEVLKDELMDPIGASDTWRYLGYENSWVDVHGQLLQSVTGGTRWGGGIWINSFDHARFGLLLLRGGNGETGRSSPTSGSRKPPPGETSDPTMATSGGSTRNSRPGPMRRRARSAPAVTGPIPCGSTPSTTSSWSGAGTRAKRRTSSTSGSSTR